MEKIKIVIGIEDEKTVEKLVEELDLKQDIEIVGIANEGKETIKKIKELSPDVAIISIVLSGIDGLGVLEFIKDNHINTKCIMIGVTGEKSEKMIYENGASCIMQNPIDYKLMTYRIKNLYKIKKHKEKREETQISRGRRIVGSLINVEDTRVEEKIRYELYSFGILPTLKGYKFLGEIIKQKINNTDLLRNFQEDIYPYIAVKFKTKVTIVESAIRNAIKTTYKQRPEIYEKYLKNKKAPTVIEFIEEITEKIKLENGS